MTIVMNTNLKHTVSKSAFKSKALQYFREVEKSRTPLVITDHGKPVLKVVPFSEDPEAVLRELRGSVIEYVDPTEPVGDSDWEVVG
jgi:prevent-host-death family protein